MSKRCLSCFNKSVKAEDVVEPVVLKDDEEETPTRRQTCIIGTLGYNAPEYLSTSADFYGKLGEGDSSSSLKNDFNKVKTFDLRGVTTTTTTTTKEK
ncbi:unnamed protein product [Brassica oleracea var. botrytis]|uniref:Uncharacterized protein n=3 Tax=Brassica TaxID=3705 RepID=A0ABQ8AUH9_BRANA|nr:PREDICTED: uncharacterized protein LOC106326665 [Brassica oleracea var. oleracea]XP_022567063.2 uncharacterized protein LOC111210760 [Brassica napus]KAH0896157.1 hypothetical protein HID58_045725 [Brassica napus]VDD20315.1 unnamed protein product [Brassica oleracea]